MREDVRRLEMAREYQAAVDRAEDRYTTFINAMLLASTFAGTVTLSIILTPTNTPIPGIVELAYAGSLFLGGIMGCILMVLSVGIELPRVVLIIEMIIVSGTLYVAFYLLLFASTFYLSNQGPFIIGSILYLGFCFLTIVFFAVANTLVNFRTVT
jgi:hypothetical protein